MFGCLRRIGCLIVLVGAAGAAYYWYTHRKPAPSAPEASAAGTWLPVTNAAAQRAAAAITRLQSVDAKPYVNLGADEVAGYVIARTGAFPDGIGAMQAMISGDTLYIRTAVDLRTLGAGKILGPLGSMLGARDSVQMGGVVEMLSTGHAQFRITAVRVKDFNIPKPVIPKLLQQLQRDSAARTRVGTATDGIPFTLPPHVGDLHIANGKVTAYKKV